MSLQTTLSQISSHKTGDMEYSVATLPGWATSGVIEPETGWILCNGAILSNTGKYTALYALLGTIYGAAGQLPTLIEGVQPIGGAFGTIGSTRGASSVTITKTHITPHQHTYVNGTIEQFMGDYNGWMGFNDPPGTGDGGNDNYQFTTDGQGGGGAHNNMPPFVVVEGMMVKL